MSNMKKEDIFIKKELDVVHMNEKEFNFISVIYSADGPIFFRDIVRSTKLPYGSVQSILKRYDKLLTSKLEDLDIFMKKIDELFEVKL